MKASHEALSSRDSRAVFAFEPILHDLELQRPDCREQRHFLHRIPQFENLHHAFLQQLLETLAELFELRRIRIVQKREALRRESAESRRKRSCRSSVSVSPMPNSAVPDQPDDIAGIGFVDGLAFLREKLVRAGKAHLFARAGVRDRHVALEFPGADAHERDAVAMPRIHVRLDLENEAGESGQRRLDRAFAGTVRLRR